ncbi:hypothetical protein DNTS_017568 [Danionella cerebrum]|nr:hypothetical protein DNTS_017568 [Danionella translucida]
MLVLMVSLCMLRYCCKHCRKDPLSNSNLDLSNSQHIYVIPNPIHFREEDGGGRGEEQVTCEDSDFTPPPYELVCPPPSYAEASLKLDISGDSEMDVPPPPYSPPLNVTPESSFHQH